MKKNKPAAGKAASKSPATGDESSRKSPKLKPVPKAKNWKNSIFEEDDEMLFQDNADLDSDFSDDFSALDEDEESD